MKIILVHIGDIIYCPPALNVIEGMLDLGHEVVVCTTESTKDIYEKYEGQIILEEISVNYEKPINQFKKMSRLHQIKKKLWKIINNHYNENSIIWVVSDVSIKHLGHKLIGKKYILHLMELSERLTYHHKLPFLKLDAHKLGNNAYKVIVPEYNRAHITKAWWELNELPFVLENKPYINHLIEKKSEITQSNRAKELINELKDKKIILYQGIVHRERPLDEFIKAVELLGNDYAFLLMTKGDDIYKSLGSKNYYFLPFIEPPYHLEITSHAHIGILSYFPVQSHYSKLNALYCAPNKTFEYGKFGVPMISNDVPGLEMLFNTFNCGISVNKFNAKEIKEAIERIENNYFEYSANSKEFYKSVDMKKKLREIID